MLCLELVLLVGDGALVCLVGAWVWFLGVMCALGWICGTCLGLALLTVVSTRERTSDFSVCVDSGLLVTGCAWVCVSVSVCLVIGFT